jgi:crotonobetainyl-CoA:carnitine CoA-transferase CaiB-like acyl-CoA transferase
VAHLSEQALLPPPAHARSRADALAAELAKASAAIGDEVRVDVDELLFGRAALSGTASQGRTSAGGTCRLLRAADGWVAVNLARPEDVDAVGALLQRRAVGDAWDELEVAAAATTAADVAARAQLLGIPAARLGELSSRGSEDSTHGTQARRGGPRRADQATVVDLSSLWAGPLCGHLLGRAGARVIKVESTSRPDGARGGSGAFFDQLNGDKEHRSVDLSTTAGIDELRHLLASADAVIESSRPRALRQLGIDADEHVRAGATWVSITGYGRAGPAAKKVAFGDDAAVAGGLVEWDADGAPLFCGDAIADPLTGLFAALGALRSIGAGGGRLLDCPLAAVAASIAAPP